MHVASFKNSINVMKLLLKYGSDPTIQCESGNTPLLVACFNNSKDAVKLLLEDYKHTKNITNIVGDTPMHVAAEIGSAEIVEILLKIDNNIFFARTNCDGNTALHIATEFGHIEIINMLVNADQVFNQSQFIKNDSNLAPIDIYFKRKLRR